MLYKYIFVLLLLVWALLVYFVSGEKYMKWYYGSCGLDYRKYDPKRFKIAHSLSLMLVTLFAFLAITLENSGITLLFIVAALILNYLLILTWCKKKNI